MALCRRTFINLFRIGTNAANRARKSKPDSPACTMLWQCTNTLEEFLMAIDPGPHDLSDVHPTSTETF